MLWCRYWKQPKNSFSFETVFCTPKATALLFINFNLTVMQNTEKSPVQTKNEQTRLANFFKLLSTDDTAKLLRQTVFTLSEFYSLPDAHSSITYSDRVNSFCFYLNQLAESIEPYYTKE